MTREEIFQQWGGCTLCELCETRDQVVIGYGNESARLMVIADRPGYQENITGIPMTGPAGLYYVQTLEQLGLDLESVWTTNCVACLPPDNRDPFLPELTQCKERLYQEIRMVDPDVIVIMGKVTLKLLTGTTSAMGKVQKKTFLVPVPGVHTTLHYPAIVTYNPGYVRKNPSQKRGQPWYYFFNTLKMARDACNLLENAHGTAGISR